MCVSVHTHTHISAEVHYTLQFILNPFQPIYPFQSIYRTVSYKLLLLPIDISVSLSGADSVQCSDMQQFTVTLRVVFGLYRRYSTYCVLCLNCTDGTERTAVVKLLRLQIINCEDGRNKILRNVGYLYPSARRYVQNVSIVHSIVTSQCVSVRLHAA